MGREKQVRKSFLRSLLHDKAANTIVISAAALIPLTAMVGGGIDASRYYMAETRLQAACDAGALAARRAMTDDTFTTAHRQIGLNFFDQNFEDGMFGLTNGTRTYAGDAEGVVTGTASGTLPTSIMGIFGYTSFDLAVECSAEINISNTDIMFVLDVTGSMNCPDTSPGCGNNGNNESSTALIKGLRLAVMSFYDTVEAATADTAQVRYGVVPYAPNINVGFSLPRAYLANVHTYQSRVARFREDITIIPEVPGNGINVGDEIVISDGEENLPREISNFGSTNDNDYRFRNNNRERREEAQDFCWNTLPGTYQVSGETWQVFSGTEYRTGMWSGGAANNRAGCIGRVRKTRIATPADVIPYEPEEIIRTIAFDGYTYCPVNTDATAPCGVTNPAGSPAGWETVDLRTLYDDNQIQMPTGNEGAFETLTWNGCIEEAETVNVAAWNPVPAGANDLNINLIPSTEVQRWKPLLRNATWRRVNDAGNRQLSDRETTSNLSHPTSDCPAPARKLAEISRADLQTYINGLSARGSTYHDLGMIWGARFISPRGIFASENATAPNGDAIGRHIVFMTDGRLEPNIDQYGTYGMEWWDRRVTTDGFSNVNTRHEARFQAACRAARQENITVWVVAFGTNLTDSLRDCASPGRAYEASNSVALTSAFREIAQKIAALRLTA